MKTALWLAFLFLWIGGVVSGGVSPSAPWAAPLFLVLAGSLALLENRPAARSMLIAAGLGFGFEIAGVHTGYPFGPYRYTNVLAPSLAGVPVAIAFAWLILIDFVRGVTPNVFLCALLMTAIDLVIDPLAAGPLGYWLWLKGGPYYGVPVINFVGWFIASLVIFAVTPKQEIRKAYVGWSVIAFFAVLAFRQRFFLPGAIGLTLLAIPFFQLAWRGRPWGTSSQSLPGSGSEYL